MNLASTTASTTPWLSLPLGLASLTPVGFLLDSDWIGPRLPRLPATTAPQVPTQPTRRILGASMSHILERNPRQQCHTSRRLRRGTREGCSKAQGVRLYVRRANGHDAQLSYRSHTAVQLGFACPRIFGVQGGMMFTGAARGGSWHEKRIGSRSGMLGAMAGRKGPPARSQWFGVAEGTARRLRLRQRGESQISKESLRKVHTCATIGRLCSLPTLRREPSAVHCVLGDWPPVSHAERRVIIAKTFGITNVSHGGL